MTSTAMERELLQTAFACNPLLKKVVVEFPMMKSSIVEFVASDCFKKLKAVCDKYDSGASDDSKNVQLSVSENISHYQKLLPELSSP